MNSASLSSSPTGVSGLRSIILSSMWLTPSSLSRPISYFPGGLSRIGKYNSDELLINPYEI